MRISDWSSDVCSSDLLKCPMTSPSNRSKPSANAGALAHVSKTPDAPTAAFNAFILCLPDIPDSACIVAKWDCVPIDVRNLPWTPRKKNGRRGDAAVVARGIGYKDGGCRDKQRTG